MRGWTVIRCSGHFVEWLFRLLRCRGCLWCLVFEAGTGRRFRPQQRTPLLDWFYFTMSSMSLEVDSLFGGRNPT